MSAIIFAPHVLPALHRPVLPDPVLLRHGHRVHADHGRAWPTQLNFSVDDHGHDLLSAGNGLVNLFTPTSGAIMGGLALAKIEYSTWLKFGAKLFVVLGVVCMVILTAAMLILPGAA